MSALALWLVVAVAAPPQWRELQAGVEYARLPFIEKPLVGDGALHVVRIDAARAKLVAHASSAREPKKLRTARAWSEELGLSVVINAGMYETDFATHTGFFRIGPHLNSERWVKNYQSVLAFDPTLVFVDRDATPGDTFDAAKHQVVIQNLRLIKWPGQNVWSKNDKRWSEAAIALDRDGRLLFLFTRSPLSMHELNQKLLAGDLHVVRAMHVEGGPEASLSIHAGGIELDLCGSYETGFNENDDNARQWALPNVVGVAR